MTSETPAGVASLERLARVAPEIRDLLDELRSVIPPVWWPVLREFHAALSDLNRTVQAEEEPPIAAPKRHSKERPGCQ